MNAARLWRRAGRLALKVFVSLYIQRWKLWRFVSFNAQMHCGVDLKASLPMF